MILDKALLLKCLGGAVALAGTGTTAVLGFSYLNTDSPESLLENSGLSCTFNSGSNTNEGSCTSVAENKKINVKYGDGTTKVEGVGLSNISDSGPKIKVQKNVTEGGYNQNLKLTIEGGDITLTNGATAGTPAITKLEEFETYEIVKELFGKYYLSRKSTALEGKSKALGLPIEDSACKLPTNGSTTCQLDEAKLKKINFDGKNGDLTIESGGTPEITLTITKTTDTSTYSTEAYKFAFESNKDITISSSNKIMKNTNTEFKIKETTSSDSAKTLSLEKVWNVTKLAEKVNIKCPNSNGDKKCTIDNNKEISYKDSANSSDIKKLTTTSEVTEKITYEEDQADYNQGFKFTFSENAITTTGGSETLTAGTYQIKEEGGKWYLVKKE